MTVQKHAGASVPSRASGTVEVYDFRRPTTLVREHSRVLELAFETFARQWGTQLTAKVRVVSNVTCTQVLMFTYDEYAAALPPTTAMVLLNVEGVTPRAVIQFPTSAALTWVSCMLGGRGIVVEEERQFTQIEQALVRRLMEDALEDLRYSLGALLVRRISIDNFQYNSQFAQAAAMTDLMIVASFTIKVGESQSVATVAMPSEVLLPQLGEANPTVSVEDAPRLLREQIVSTPVSVSLRLEPAMMRPSAVLDLAVGDILPLPHPQHRPLEVAVEGTPLARAAVGANGSRLACVVIETD
ncbi:flagellar motor switch protein FliM [Salinibacterium sp. SYSU T00001]|uniref:flagellar motor switch protein FliM n=1 Tax=Homoserinimonas sedimenticola TaxID=2986805 RepID=UPI0022354531|nr:flagellar motor switch protein FliM [Salinibacterium sedimenticola]MCW4385724.1 flagellar motor switch protein FliM [Salinibacterium sedimenticola]